MFLLDQLTAISNCSTPRCKRKSVERKKTEGLTKREQEHLDVLISMGGRGTTVDIGHKVKGMYYSSMMYLRKLEAKGIIRVAGVSSRKGANSPYIWEVIPTGDFTTHENILKNS